MSSYAPQSNLASRRAVWEPVIREAARKWGAPEDLVVKVVECESGFKPNAQNAYSTASGLFQFLDSTWKSQSTKYGVTTQKNDPYGQIEVATHMIADGGITHWNASKSCWGSVK